MAFTIRHSSGVICVPMPADMLDRLEIPLMTPHNKDKLRTAYTISVDARDGVTTGISAADRAHTARVLADSATEPWEITRPGHVFPLRYREGGVLVRRGHTEAAVDLARLAGLTPAGVLVEVVNDDGTMKRAPELRAFADEHGLAMISIEDLVRYRRRHERHVERVGGDPAADAARRLHGVRLPDHHRRQRAHRPGVRRHRGAGAGADPRALRVPDRRRVRQPALRLRPAARRGARARSSQRAGASWSTCAATRAAGSGWSPSCRPTSCRTAAATPSTPTSTSACRPTRATTAPPPRSCATSASPSVRLLTNNPDKTDEPGGLRHRTSPSGCR